MGYLDVMKYVKGVPIDRIPLDDFTVNWEALTGVTAALSTTNTTINANSLQFTGLDDGLEVYKTFTTPFRLDDRDTIHFHIKSSKTTSDGDLTLILSDSPSILSVIDEIEVPTLTAGVMTSVKVSVTTPLNLGSIRSVGFRGTAATASAVFHLAAIEATSNDFVITKEHVESFEDVGERFVLSKINEDAMPDDPELVEAKYMAAGAHVWMWITENDARAWDYGGKSSTQNYGIRLLTEAERRCEEYLYGGDTNPDGTPRRKIRIFGGYSEMKR